MGSCNPRSRSRSRTSPPAEAPAAVMIRVICGDSAISRMSAEHRSELPETVQRLVVNLTVDQRNAVVRRYGLDGEGSILDIPVLAAKLRKIPRQVQWSLASAERALRDGIGECFPEVLPPKRTPMNS